MLQHGLKKNWKQFAILVLVNAFVGGMVGIERSILPLVAEHDFLITDKNIILSFIIVFGISKALANYLTGRLANKFGRKSLLVTGWILALPLPFVLMFAQSWTWIVFSNVLLGIHQGFAWSSTVVMKMDLVNEDERGLAMGLNEFAGYLTIAVVAYLTAYIADHYGLRPYPFYTGVVLAVVGLLMTIFLVKETKQFMQVPEKTSNVAPLKNVFKETTLSNPNLSSITQAGLINNLNDGMVWGLLPLMMSANNFSLKEIGVVASVYPAVWGLGQIFTGKLADSFGRKPFLVGGMLLQGIAILLFMPASTLTHYVILSFILGIGTAMVYPVFLAAIADNSHISQRAETVGVFRLWRDLGYAIGAFLTGILSEIYNIETPILVIGVVTLLSGILLFNRYRTNQSYSNIAT
jgi:MFS family permease